MSVGRKVLRRMKKVMGVIGAVPVLTACSSQVSCAKVNVEFNDSTATLRFSGNGIIDDSWQKCYKPCFVRRVVIEDGIKEIGKDAFWACESLQEITISNSVNIIGNGAFWCCRSLEKINIPNSVNTIGNGAFGGCHSLKKINIPNSVNTIDNRTFYSCTSLQEITIPNSVSTIGDSAFWSCKALEKITIPNSVTSIGKHAFWSCKALEKITLPRSLDTIDKCAFHSCIRLKAVKFDNDNYEKNITLKEGVFKDCKELRYFNTNGLKIECGLQAFDGTPLQHLGGRVVCGEHCRYTHEMMRRMFSQLQGANKMFQRADYIPNDDGNIKKPTNCPRSY